MADTTTRPPRRALRVTTKALPEHNRRNNRALILQTLFRSGAMSRADLARESGLTRVTVSDLVAELVAEDLLEELGPRPGAHVGKPAMLVGLNDDAYQMIALDLSADDEFIGAIVNLRGDVLVRKQVTIGASTGQDALAHVLRLCRELTDALERPLLGIGIGSPGIVDHTGTVLEAPNLGWYRLDLARLVADEFDTPVYVGNDANAAALAVHSFRETSGLSLMVVTIEHGVGAGLIIGGALVTGEQYAAGEIGHVVVDEDGERCACGRRGCLEPAIAVPHLRERLEAPGADRRQVLADAGRALGIALAPVISALNLNEVVLCGPRELIDGPLLNAARSTVSGRTMSAVSNGLDMHLALESENLVLLGAGVFVLSAELGVS